MVYPDTDNTSKSLPPLLSFVIMARNDEYMGNAKWRLETTLDFLATSLSKLGRLQDAEVVIVDWQSEVPIYVDLKVCDLTSSIIRHILVPQILPRSINFECDFPRPVILNIGIRRSRGQYIIQTLGDVLWPVGTLQFLFDTIENGKYCDTRIDHALVVIGRKEIPYDIACKTPSILFLREYINDHPENIADVPPLPYLLVPADSFMMHRDLWYESRAFDEQLQRWGWLDCDLILRLQLKYKILTKNDNENLLVYHLNHIAPDQINEIVNRKTNPWVFNNLTVNTQEWGLGDMIFSEYPLPAFDDLMAKMNNTGTYISYYRIKHFIKLLVFLVSNFNIANIKLFLLCFLHMLFPFSELRLKHKLSLLFSEKTE